MRRQEIEAGGKIKKRQKNDFRKSVFYPFAIVQRSAQQKDVLCGESPGHLGPIGRVMQRHR